MIESRDAVATEVARVARGSSDDRGKTEPKAQASAEKSPGRLRIAQIVTAMDCGGVPDHIVKLARGLSRHHEVTIICRDADPQYATALAKAGIEIVRIPFRRAPNPLADLQTFWLLVRLLRERRFDVVHTHRSKAALLGLLAARAARIPVAVNTAHMFGFMILRHALGRGVFWIYDKLLFAVAADGVITVSHSIRSAVIAGRVLPAHKVHNVYYGIEADRDPIALPPARLRASLGVHDEAVVIIVVARHVPQKGLDMMIAAAAQVVNAAPEAQFLLVGDGPLREELEQQAASLGLGERARFLGERSDVSTLLQIADIFALSSVAEGLPIAILEAMAAGKPVVATAVDGIPEAVLDGETGLIVRSRDPAEMATALTRLVADPLQRRRMGRDGRKRLEREFSIERMTANMEALYRNLADRRKPQTTMSRPADGYARDLDAV